MVSLSISEDSNEPCLEAVEVYKNLNMPFGRKHVRFNLRRTFYSLVQSDSTSQRCANCLFGRTLQNLAALLLLDPARRTINESQINSQLFLMINEERFFML